MANERRSVRPGGVWALRWIARIILITWAAFWIFFSVTSGIWELGQVGWGSLLLYLMLAVIIFLMLYQAWTDELSGGICLIFLSIAFFLFGWGKNVFVMLTLYILPLIAGILLIVLARLSRRDS